MNFRVSKVFKSYRLLQTVLFFTDSVFRVLFAYFDASMASIKWYVLHLELVLVFLEEERVMQQ